MSFFHGFHVNEPVDGVRPIVEKSLAIVGLVATAPNATPDVKAKLLTGVVGSNNAQTFTAKLAGVLGMAISIAFINPMANSQALAVTVEDKAISVSLATSAGGAITTTATQLAAAIAANADAHALVGVANTAGSSGAGTVTALVATELAGGVDEPFPLDTPVLVTGARDAAGYAGAGGTLKKSLLAIADQCLPLVVVVRVAVGEDVEDQDALVVGDTTGGVYTGIQALLAAEGKTGIRPRILGAPGLDTQPVANALQAAANVLRGYVYAACRGDDGKLLATRDLAVQQREEFGDREIMLFWPDWKDWDGYATATALGLRAMLDQTVGFHKSISNVAVNGPTGISHPVSFDIRGTAHDAHVLNQAPVTTLIRDDGYKFWGNRGCSAEPYFAFEVATRTAQAIQDVIADALKPYIDRPMTVGLVRNIVETANMRLGNWQAQGRIIGGTCWFDPDLNPIDKLQAGQLEIDFDFTPVAPLEGLTLNQRITGKYYANLASQVNG